MDLPSFHVDARPFPKDPKAGLTRRKSSAELAFPAPVVPGHDVVKVCINIASIRRSITSHPASARPRIGRAMLELEGRANCNSRENFCHNGFVLHAGFLEAVRFHRSFRETLSVTVRLAIPSPPPEGLLSFVRRLAPRPVGRHLAHSGQRIVISLEPPCLLPEIGVRIT